MSCVGLKSGTGLTNFPVPLFTEAISTVSAPAARCCIYVGVRNRTGGAPVFVEGVPAESLGEKAPGPEGETNGVLVGGAPPDAADDVALVLSDDVAELVGDVVRG